MVRNTGIREDPHSREKLYLQGRSEGEVSLCICCSTVSQLCCIHDVGEGFEFLAVMQMIKVYEGGWH